MVRVIKMTEKQYELMRKLIINEFGNVSFNRGLYLLGYIYNKHIPNKIRMIYRKRFYQNMKDRRKNIWLRI